MKLIERRKDPETTASPLMNLRETLRGYWVKPGPTVYYMRDGSIITVEPSDDAWHKIE